MPRRVSVLANFTARQVAISRSGSKGVRLLNKELSFIRVCAHGHVSRGACISR